MTVREKNGLELTLVVQEVTLADISQLHLVLTPCSAIKMITSERGSGLLNAYVVWLFSRHQSMKLL